MRGWLHRRPGGRCRACSPAGSGLVWVRASVTRTRRARPTVPLRYSSSNAGGGPMVAPQLDTDLNDPVTRHMHKDFTQLRVGQTVGEALASLRERPPEGRIIYF